MNALVAPPADSSRPVAPLAPPPAAAPVASAGTTPLLPAMLTGPESVLGLWLLPVALMLALNVQGYALIEGNLTPGQRGQAIALGLAGASNVLLAVLGYVLGRRARAEGATALHPAWSGVAVATQVGYLWLAFTSMDSILPRAVPAWIYPPERFLFNQFSFAMLPLFHGLLQLAGLRSATGSTSRAIVRNVALAIAAPTLVYLLGVVVRGSRDPGGLVVTAVAIFFVLCGIAMFVGLMRATLLGLRAAQKWGSDSALALVGVVGLALPMAGLMLNSTIPFPVDFQAWEVYALLLVNGVILLMAAGRGARYPRTNFCLLCATLPFSLYFFVVLLPYTPLAVFAILAMGAGFLVLSPTLLFVTHLFLLQRAWRELPGRIGPFRPAVAGALAFALLPLTLVHRAWSDRAALHAALDHAFAPTIAPGPVEFPGSRAELRRALASHRAYKHGTYYPLVSDFYSWAVFDHLVLPDAKLQRIEELFFGSGDAADAAGKGPRGSFMTGRGNVASRTRMPRAVDLPHDIDVRALETRIATVDERNSTLTVALTLAARGSANTEYVKLIPLPAGVQVNGFRLHIDGVPVPGRIVEKKTALWVYEMIRDGERRDPGLLLYKSPGELELRVFPVVPGKPSTVEIDFLVPGRPTAPDRRDVAELVESVGRTLAPQVTHLPEGSVAALGGGTSLAAVPREPYLHIIVDRSSEGFDGDLAAALRTLAKEFPRARRARVTAANYNVVDLVPGLTPLDELGASVFTARGWPLRREGGFAADVALARAIRRHRDADLDRPAGDALPPQPIFVILSRTAVARELPLLVTTPWADLLPGLDVREHGADGTRVVYRNSSTPATPLLRLGNSVRPVVGNLPTRFAVAPGASPLEFWSPTVAAWQRVAGVSVQPASTPWSRGMALHLAQQDHARSPGDALADLNALVAESRSTGVLIPGTSYIVVENAAQWRMLEASEKQKLGQHAALEFRETPAPPAVWLGLGFAAWLGARRWWQRHAQRR